MEQITVEPIPILVGREDDGRWWADIALMPLNVSGPLPG